MITALGDSSNSITLNMSVAFQNIHAPTNPIHKTCTKPDVAQLFRTTGSNF
jgi:hypothetical protein